MVSVTNSPTWGKPREDYKQQTTTTTTMITDITLHTDTRTRSSIAFSWSTIPLTDFSSYIISMRAKCIIVTGTDLTQTSASGSFKSELDLMQAYSDWASG